MKMMASSFADPADVAAYKKAKAQGKTDNEARAVGDNGVGCWGDSTVAGTGPACALHKSLIESRWGKSWKKTGKHKTVRVRYGNSEIVCALKDICGMRDRIDLNPDAVAAIGLTPPILVTVYWEWTT